VCQDELTILEPVGLCLPRGKGRRFEIFAAAIAPIGGERSAVQRVDAADTILGATFNADKVFSAECGSLNRRAETDWIPRPALNRQVVYHTLAKADQVVSDKRGAGKQQCRATDQHVHSGQFCGNRVVADSGHGLSISRRGFSSHTDRHLEKFRAQSQASMLDSSEVNLKADFLFFEDKLDHAATLRELRRVTDGQNACLSRDSMILSSGCPRRSS